MNINDYINIIRQVGNGLIKSYSETNKAQTGINGPYDDPETEVRYLAHLLVITAVEYLKYNKVEYEDVIVSIADRLLSMKQSNGVYKMRMKSGKDECNGTIGHAWLIEGYLYAYKALREQKFLVEIERIFLMHSFSNRLGLWGRPLLGCNDNSIDYTFNHQLWYAATLAEFLQVKPNKELQRQLKIFLEKLPQTVTTSCDGRVAHAIYGRISLKAAFKYKIVKLRDGVNDILSRPSLRYKEIGYHVFNLMAFARIYKLYPNVTFFNSSRFKKALGIVSTSCFIKELEADNMNMDASTHGSSLASDEQSINIYGYPYNVPGFEIMYCGGVFSDIIGEETVQKMMTRQFELTWDNESKKFGRLCHDKVSVNYRVYEFYRYLEEKK